MREVKWFVWMNYGYFFKVVGGLGWIGYIIWVLVVSGGIFKKLKKIWKLGLEILVVIFKVKEILFFVELVGILIFFWNLLRIN